MKKRFLSVLAVLIPCALMPQLAYAAGEGMGVISQHPSLSPSGDEVVFSADFDGQTRIWASRIDGSNLRKLSTTAERSGTELEPAWSPDGQRVAYSSRSGASTDIWVMGSDGYYPTRLTSNMGNNTSPSWSPDGNRLVFISDRDGTKDVWIMNSNGSGQSKLVASAAQENNPRFSPTGAQIVFSRTEDEVANLMVVNVNGTGLRQLTTGAAQDWEPHWGTRGIIFTSNRGGARDTWNLWKIQSDGTGLIKLGDVPGHDPSWLQDGRVVFTDEALQSKAAAAVSILDPATGKKHVVADVQGYLTPSDVRPGKTPNRINPQSAGKIWVAILSTRTLDAPRAVAPQTITFGRSGTESSMAYCKRNHKDVNGDGLPDLLCRFSLRQAGFKPGDTTAILRFDDVRGVPYESRDSIVVVSEDDADDFKDD